MRPNTKTAYRFDFQGRGMVKPAIRYVSRLGLAIAVRQVLSRIGCVVSPVARVKIGRCRGYDDERYAGITPAESTRDRARLHRG